MRRITAILTAILLLVAIPVATEANVWERIEQTRVDPSEGERVEVEVREGYVYVMTNRPVTVKICTILGQVVSQEKLQPGVSRIKLKAKGVYILKIGSITKRVNI